MQRDRLSFVAAMSLIGFLGLAVAVKAFAGAGAAASDVKFACSHHGPSNMQLTLTLMAGTGTPQTIEIHGKNNNGTKWFVFINGTAAENGNGGMNKDPLKVRSGDKITWVIDATAPGGKPIMHGVAFANQDLANAMLDFDTTTPGLLPLEDLSTTLVTPGWMMFGPKLWGAKPIQSGDNDKVMVSCMVK